MLMIQKITLLVFLLGIGIHGQAQPKIGSVAPDIQLTNSNGEQVSLHSLRGKVVLVDFWASWCMPCRKSNRSIVPVYNRFKNKGFEIYGISLDQDTASWHKAVNTDRISWLQFNDRTDGASNTAAIWQIAFLPTSFLLNKKGEIVSVDPGAVELQKYLSQALK
jgi:peroxiredoxin